MRLLRWESCKVNVSLFNSVNIEDILLCIITADNLCCENRLSLLFSDKICEISYVSFCYISEQRSLF